MARSMMAGIAMVSAAFSIAMGAARAEEAPTNAGVSGEKDYRLYCASCHGEEGKGDGPKSFGLSVPAPDLTILTNKYGTFPTEKLEAMIDGRDAPPGHVEREMPVWGVWFKEEAAQDLGGAEGDEGSIKRRIANLIGFIQSLQQ